MSQEPEHIKYKKYMGEVCEKDSVHVGSHYDYLDLIIPIFFKLVFGEQVKPSYYAGLSSAHGDKCCGYKYSWQENGINFYRGALLYMLTYTSELDVEKHKSKEWVINNYQKYLPLIETAESHLYTQVLCDNSYFNQGIARPIH